MESNKTNGQYKDQHKDQYDQNKHQHKPNNLAHSFQTSKPYFSDSEEENEAGKTLTIFLKGPNSTTKVCYIDPNKKLIEVIS